MTGLSQTVFGLLPGCPVPHGAPLDAVLIQAVEQANAAEVTDLRGRGAYRTVRSNSGDALG